MADLLLLDVITNSVKDVKCEDLEDYYQAINCQCFDIATRYLGDKAYDMFVDDIGVFNNLPVSAIDDFNMPMLLGNIVFANHDAEGNTTSLTDEDKAHIKKYIKKATEVRESGPIEHLILTHCNY